MRLVAFQLMEEIWIHQQLRMLKDLLEVAVEIPVHGCLKTARAEPRLGEFAKATDDVVALQEVAVSLADFHGMIIVIRLGEVLWNQSS